LSNGDPGHEVAVLALRQADGRYVWTVSLTEDAFDCSQLVQWAMTECGG
jgi:cell wall-associated NlpC family hydrolase